MTKDLRITFNDATSIDITVPDDKVQKIIAVPLRRERFSDAELGLFISGNDVRSIHDVTSSREPD